MMQNSDLMRSGMQLERPRNYCSVKEDFLRPKQLLFGSKTLEAKFLGEK